MNRCSVPKVGSREKGDLLCRGELLENFVDVKVLCYMSVAVAHLLLGERHGRHGDEDELLNVPLGVVDRV